jgi:type IV secretion system protein VirB5
MMPFKRAVQRYGQTPEADTPYHKAGQLWDERIGNARVQAANWRLMAFGTLTLASGLAIALVWQSLQSRVVPYVIEVDRLGEARAVTLAESAYQPTDPQIAWFLARFIKDVRSRSLDPVLMRGDWLQAYDFVSPRGALFLGDYARADDPFAKAGEKTVSVEVTSVVRASDRSFQVKWTETTYERGSLGAARAGPRWFQWSSAPKQADILRKNPLGLYVDAIDWSRELDSAADRPASSNPAAPAANPRFPAPTAQPDAGAPVITPSQTENRP